MLGWLRTLPNCSYCTLHTFTIVVVVGAINERSTAIHGEVSYSNRFDTTTVTLRRIESRDVLVIIK